MSIEKILIVDDEIILRNFLSETLRRKGFDVVTAESGSKTLSLLKETNFDLVITDMKLPDTTGIEILRKIKELNPQTIVVIITAFGSIENAVEAMRLGAFNYLIKPFSPDAIEAVIEKAQEHHSLVAENQYLRQELSGAGSKLPPKMVAESPVMKQLLSDVMRVAASNASIFIHGESGTGKEVIAHAIHHNSPRANKPFIKVNCAAVPEALIESEFFGHEKGAFTGANARRLGRFELANGGTLMLDEITETPLALQAKLLRVIQEQEFERVGGSKSVKVDVRLIATSNRDMKEAMAEKLIREDLYYRLNVVPINIPPLRDRKDDVLPLAEYFLEKLAKENHRPPKTLTPAARKKLLAYSWPGNIRELANIIERAVVVETGTQIAPDHLLIEAVNESPESTNLENRPGRGSMTLQELEKKLIVETLEANHNNKTKTAESLGITTKVLRSKLEEHHISV